MLTMIQYSICPIDPDSHYFEVTVDFVVSDTQDVTLTLPNWIPGSYMIRDFAKHILCFEAYSESGALTYQRPTKSTWHLKNAVGAVTVRYRVYAFDNSIRAAYLDRTYGFFNATSLCLSVAEQDHGPHQLTLLPSPHPALALFDVATGMPALQDGAPNSYIAENYDALIDYPFLLGEFTRIPFTASDIPHELVLVGKHYASCERLADDLKKICEAQHQLWGEAPDINSYQFLTIVTATGFGGLEHRNSTALMCSRAALEYGPHEEPSDAYLEFLSLCSHEYFHNWNIKRLKPRSFIPYQLQQESYTEQLWFYEGVTSFYDDLMVLRAGSMSSKAYLKRLANTLSRGLRGLGPQRQSITESSQLAWTTFYQQNENAVNAISSYYAKGAATALCLDLLIRKHSDHRSSLDDVLRRLWTEHGPSAGNAHGTTQAELLSACNPDEHPDISAFLEQALYQTTPLPWQSLLESVGVKAQRAAFDDALTLGAVLQAQSTGMQVQRVVEGSMAAEAGLAARDLLIAIDGLQATPANLKAASERFENGRKVQLHYFRDEQLLNGSFQWRDIDRERIELIEGEQKLPWLEPPWLEL